MLEPKRTWIRLAAFVVCAIPAIVADSHARSTNECLSATAQSRSDSFRRCSATCSTQAAKRFAACFGPGTGCIRGCQKARDLCEVGPNAEVQDCENGAAATSCLSQLNAALGACGSASDPTDCRITARVDAVACNEKCFTAQARAFETCVQTADDCEHRCPAK